MVNLESPWFPLDNESLPRVVISDSDIENMSDKEIIEKYKIKPGMEIENNGDGKRRVIKSIFPDGSLILRGESNKISPRNITGIWS